jgi:NHL repeat
VGRGLRAGLFAAALAAMFALPSGASAFGLLSSFGEFGSGPGQLDSPAQIATAPGGDLYVADSGNDRVSVFAGDGSFVRTFGSAQLDKPGDVAFGDDGKVYVADTGNDRIAVFGSGGEFLFPIGEGELEDPSGLDVDAAISGGTVYVADTGNDRVAAFTPSGTPLTPIEPIGSPRDVIVGSGGNLYVADLGEERVDVFSKAGALIRSFGEAGSGSGELTVPVALASEDAGGVYVADEADERVARFDAGGSFLSSFKAVPDVAGVGVACGANVFVSEGSATLARVQRFGDPESPFPPCLAPPGEPIKVTLIETPSNRFRFAGLIKNRSNGFAVLYVRVPGPGKVELKGRGFRRLSRTARQATKVRLPIKPKIRLRHFLKQHGKGRIRAVVTFAPTGGVPRTLEKVIVLRRPRG